VHRTLALYAPLAVFCGNRARLPVNCSAFGRQVRSFDGGTIGTYATAGWSFFAQNPTKILGFMAKTVRFPARLIVL
jgi:hypothetical protein